MEKFKTHWEIQHNWQLLFPFFGILILGYSSFKIANALLNSYQLIVIVIAAIAIFSYCLNSHYLYLKNSKKSGF